MIFVIVLNFTGHRLKHFELFNGMELTEFLSRRTKISETICIKLKIHNITDVPVELIHKYYELKQWDDANAASTGFIPFFSKPWP